MTRDPARAWRAVCLLGVVVVLAVTAAVLRAGVLPIEATISRALAGWTTPAVRAVAELANTAGTWRFLLPATLLLLVALPDARRRWWLWGAVLVVAPLATEAWQELVARPRPHAAALGFPSGHATAVAAFAVVVFHLVGRARVGPLSRVTVRAAGIALALVVGLARVVLGRHWPGDVIVGFALGAACAAGGAWWDAAHPARLGQPARRPMSERRAAE
jgi:membrane-associated phospholipid phosphatase